MKRLAASLATALALSAALLVGVATPAAAIPTSTPVAITSSIGVPDRGDTNLAWDGNTGTDTYTTPSNTTDVPSYLEFGFASAPVNHIRILKDNYVGPHDLVIQYSTSTASDLHSRVWKNVTHLKNGFFGTEKWDQTTSVNPNGTVTGDNEIADAFNSLTFDQVTATGIRIVFSNTNPCCNHYHVWEFQAAHFEPPIRITSPNGGEAWARGSTHSIDWTYTGSDTRTVKLVLRRGGNFVATLAASRPIGTGGTGSFSWTVPNGLPAGFGYSVRILVNAGTQTDVSDRPFRIT